jgi:hypothetical protein
MVYRRPLPNVCCHLCIIMFQLELWRRDIDHGSRYDAGLLRAPRAASFSFLRDPVTVPQSRKIMKGLELAAMGASVLQ